MFISGHFHILGMRKPHFQIQCNANREVATTSPPLCNEPHLSHVLFVKVVRRRGYKGGMHPPTTDLKRCWHDTWFHWKSSPKYFCTAHYPL